MQEWFICFYLRLSSIPWAGASVCASEATGVLSNEEAGELWRTLVSRQKQTYHGVMCSLFIEVFLSYYTASVNYAYCSFNTDVWCPFVCFFRYDLMKYCWMWSFKDRPAFSAIIKLLQSSLHLAATKAICVPEVIDMLEYNRKAGLLS